MSKVVADFITKFMVSTYEDSGHIYM